MFGKSKGDSGLALKKIKDLEQELAKAKAQADLNYDMLEAINNSTHLGVWMAFYDEDGNQTGARFTDEFRRMLGYTRDELPDEANALGDLIHPDEVANVFAVFGAAAADVSGQTKYDIDYRLLTKSKDYRWFHAAGEVVRKPDGKPIVFVGTFTDIHDKKMTEATLEHDKRRQEAIDLMMLEGSWSMDLTKYDITNPSSPMVFSDQFKKILGYNNPSEFPDVMNSWITKIHPDDVQMASEKMGEQMADPSGVVVFDMEYRMMHKSGEYIWVRSSSHVTWSRDRRTPLMAAGTILDVTAAKNNSIKFTQEMAPNIANLRHGITEIAETVDEATRQMNEMAERQGEVAASAKKIEESVAASMGIITTIQGIADKTNLLSLNASIEAARAGEAGKGFAVVASEVQNLSRSTKETTAQIAGILNTMKESVDDMFEKISLISDDVAEESSEMEEIDATIESLREAAQEISDMADVLYKQN
jgi:PAS domain S-box-containing protein